MLCLHDIAAAFLLRLVYAAVVAFCCGCWVAVLLCVWSMYPEFALCFFQDDISDPHAS